MAFNAAAASEILREVYTPAIREQMFAESPLLQWLDGPRQGAEGHTFIHVEGQPPGEWEDLGRPVGKSQVAGKDFTIPLKYGGNASWDVETPQTWEGVTRSPEPFWRNYPNEERMQIVTDQQTYQRYAELLQGQPQQGNALNQSGFAYQQLAYRGIPVTYDRNVPTNTVYVTSATTNAGHDWAAMLGLTPTPGNE